MRFINLSDAADRLGVSVDYLRDVIWRADRIPTVQDPTPEADFWTSSTGLVRDTDLKTYQNMIAHRRFVRIRERYADVLIANTTLNIRPGWKSLLERVGDRIRWMPVEWGVRIRKASEHAGYMTVGFCRVTSEEDFFPSKASRLELARLYEEIRLSSLAICEECGRGGRFRYSQSPSLTLCDKHAHFAQPTLPADGLIADPEFPDD